MECTPSPHLSLTLKVRAHHPHRTPLSPRVYQAAHNQTHWLFVLRLLCSGGGTGNDPRGGASSVQLQVYHLLLCPAATAALLQRRREDRQTAPHLGAHIHVREEPESRPDETRCPVSHSRLTVSGVLQDYVSRAEGRRQR